MRGRLPVMLIMLVALALTLSLVASLAPNASAQPDPTTPGATDKWMRLNVPTAEQWQAASNPGFLVGSPRNCAITLDGMQQTNPGAFSIDSSYGILLDRWFCFGGID